MNLESRRNACSDDPKRISSERWTVTTPPPDEHPREPGVLDLREQPSFECLAEARWIVPSLAGPLGGRLELGFRLGEQTELGMSRLSR